MNLLDQLKTARERVNILENRLSDPVVFQDQKKLRKTGEEYADAKEILSIGEAYEKVLADRKSMETTISETHDEEFRKLAAEEIARLDAELPKIEEQFANALTPPDPIDKKNIILEIRAGTGGDEAALFASELARLYARYAERRGWKTSLISSNRNDLGGFKEAIFVIAGKNAFSRLKYESGVHRVQRVPETEKSGRVHTSTVTVAVLPEMEELDIQIDPKDLKIETSTAGGHGGQSVNTTYSAIRMTHLPTGITVSCQDERSQQQNRERAMQIMRARVYAYEQEKIRKERESARRNQIGTGERSEKIRTYNFPQDRVTDHRIEQNFHNLSAIMDGDVEDIIDSLKHAEREQTFSA